MEAVIRFKNLIRDIDLLFQTCGKGVLFVGNNELEAYFGKYIDKIRNFESSDIEDELMADVSSLGNNLNAVRLILRHPVASLNESGYFPEGDELEQIRGTLKALNGGEWANGVICGLSAVASWANSLISEVYGILDELDGYANNEGENKQKAKSKTITPKFSDIIQYHNKKKLLARLHYLIDGKGGASVGAVLQKAKMGGYLTRYPRREEFVSEFDLIGSWQGISNYFNENKNTCLAKSADVIIFDAEIRD